MQWKSLWKVLRYLAENAPVVIAAIEAAKKKA